MLDRISPAARQVVANAFREAALSSAPAVGTEHLLLGILAMEDTPAHAILGFVGFSAPDVRGSLQRAAQEPPEDGLQLAADARNALEHALRWALTSRRRTISVEDVLLGILRVDGGARRRLASMDVDITRLQKIAEAGLDAFQLEMLRRLDRGDPVADIVAEMRMSVATARRELDRLGRAIDVDIPAVETWINDIPRRTDEDAPVTWSPDRWVPHMGAPARRVLELALGEARARGDSLLCPEHLFLGLLRSGDGAVTGALNALGMSTDEVAVVLEQWMPPRKSADEVKSWPTAPNHVPAMPASSFTKILDRSILAARRRGHPRATPVDVLVALVEDDELARYLLRQARGSPR